MKSSFVLYLLISFFTLGSCTDCYYFANEFRQQAFVIILQKKSIKQQKVKVFEGVDLKGERALFEDAGFGELYEQSEPGDTLVKVKGTPDVKICKSDTCIIISWICGDKVVK